jgi:hypothetical protein
MRFALRAIVFVTLLSCCAVAASAQPEPARNAVLRWNDAALSAIKAAHVRSTIAARALAIVHTAMYDAWSAYDERAVPVYRSKAPPVPAPGRTDEERSAAVSYAAYVALGDLFAAQRPEFDALLTRLGYRKSAMPGPGTAWTEGYAAAETVLSERWRDGANQLGDLHEGAYSDYTGYEPRNSPETIGDPDRWQPLIVREPRRRPRMQRFLTPFWNRVTPFALTSAGELRPGPPVRFAESSAYRAQAERILALSANLTQRQKAMAEYWEDYGGESSPGRWNRFAQYVSLRDRHSLGDDVKLFFALNNAELDASIAVWDAKRFYDSVRPVTAVHALFAGKRVRAWAGPNLGTREIDGAGWEPYIQTPAFPEYVSAHCGFARAAAEVLRDFTGGDAFGMTASIPVGSWITERGPAHEVRFSWATFSQAADESGESREYAGLHFHAAIVAGDEIGRAAGRAAWERAQRYFDGTRR